MAAVSAALLAGAFLGSLALRGTVKKVSV